ncbi:MAG TPA: LemA family protein [Sulfuricurvum sp.]|nr:MAG: LemA family protein [Campylobacterales bacterium 16-40-21]OZA04261.1 MAG: LemA family protein [Sulfuricurvum sp. 17-40-25]HQS66275.1 LemA family protein [Sulfuricurvum sp.]HQT35694.1 LemA family protein [Sulfuricurvum sp.]
MNTISIIFALIAVIAVLMYNSLISKKNQVDNIFGGVDAVLKKRFDLIPNLVASVSQYMEHEKTTLETITELRASAMKPGITDDQKIALDAKLTSALGAINIAMEAYPDLKANENVMHLQRSLNEAEEQISAARRAYNQAVTDLNNAIEMFPTNLMASYMKLQPKKVFEITVNERANVDVGALFTK